MTSLDEFRDGLRVDYEWDPEKDYAAAYLRVTEDSGTREVFSELLFEFAPSKQGTCNNKYRQAEILGAICRYLNVGGSLGELRDILVLYEDKLWGAMQASYAWPDNHRLLSWALNASCSACYLDGTSGEVFVVDSGSEPVPCEVVDHGEDKSLEDWGSG